ncbi:MAG TPA: UDP-N-acetylmuramoyl-tripeptide--D-alanyl-D-alanine ligase [Anaerolineales bacterium]|nr:UDP-N-acetylmuramoyl-tripeptide--D-alanyl-D-alanine ligase [Anaerolineales bacterium]
MLTVGTILTALTGKLVANPQEVTGGVIDSRLVQKNSLFVAIPGEKTDGHRYVSTAFAKGAAVVLVQNPAPTEYPCLDVRNGKQLPSLAQLARLTTPLCIRVDDTVFALQRIASHQRAENQNLLVVGITGSVGKTTTKEVVAHTLASKHPTLFNAGNLNNEIGLPLTLLDLQSNQDYAVLEMGFYVPGEIQLLCNIARPQIGIVTNIHPVHAERAGSIANIIKGKGELLESLPVSPPGVALLNADDMNVLSMVTRTKAKVITFGTRIGTDVRASKVLSHGLSGIEIQVEWDGKSLTTHLPFLGAHYAYAVCAAVATAWVCGFSASEIETGLYAAAQRANLRMKIKAGPANSVVLDDTYNASPPSMIAALHVLAKTQAPVRWAVLGDMRELGDFEAEGHRQVGAVVPEHADRLITVGETALLIADEALLLGMDPHHVWVCKHYQQALNVLCENLQPQDVVLVKGSRAMQLDLLAQELTQLGTH